MTQEEKNNIKTFDNQLLAEGGFKALVNILFNVSEEFLKECDLEEFSNRIVENFIMSNTKDDILKFVTHHTAIVMAARLFGDNDESTDNS